MKLCAAAAALTLTILAAGGPSFEVASIKTSSAAVEVPRKIVVAPDGLTIQREPMRAIIEWAYRGSGAAEISGPTWLDTDDYDIAAKAGRPAPVEELRLMLQTLLAERFHLVLRPESRTLPGYALTAPAGAFKLREVQGEPRNGMKMGSSDGVTSFETIASMAHFCETLRMFTEGRPVVDRTGLNGVYEISLRVELEANQLERMVPGRPFQGFGLTPGIFRAVEQLGLKLEARKQPVEILVVDRVERPSPN